MLPSVGDHKGVGGVGSAAQAYAKIRAGASAVQLYTALAYRGIGLAGEIARGLDAALERDGFASVAEAVGVDRAAWEAGGPLSKTQPEIVFGL